MYDNLIKELKEDEKEKEKKTMSPELAHLYTTEYRWNQYFNGEISMEEYLDYACQRYNKKLKKKLRENLDKVEEVESAPNVREILMICEFNAQHNCKCTADIYTDGYCERCTGHAAGYGYDKESSAMADALDDSLSVLKLLYEYKDKRLEEGYSDHSELASDGHDNRDIIGYGAGYDVLPYFEGAVGVECYLSIFEKLGFRALADFQGEHCNFYHIYKEGD